jgi:hypothetical protein
MLLAAARLKNSANTGLVGFIRNINLKCARIYVGDIFECTRIGAYEYHLLSVYGWLYKSL